MGNGGYDAQHYSLGLKYDPGTKAIDATAKITARATQNLSRFDFDFLGPLKISKLTVDGRKASYTRTGAQELVITPDRGVPQGRVFTVDVAYSGVPKSINDPALGLSGWIATHDGAVALSQPFGSATWYPVNDTTHDKATYDFTVTVPNGLKVLANGVPAGERTQGANTTFRWVDRQPTASELVLMAIGHFDVRDTRTATGLRNITAVDLASVPASTTRRRPTTSTRRPPTSSTGSRSSTVASRSRRPAASACSRRTSDTPWRPRPARCTPGAPPVPCPRPHCSHTSSATSGSATR